MCVVREEFLRRISPNTSKPWISKRIHNVDPHEVAPGLWFVAVVCCLLTSSHYVQTTLCASMTGQSSSALRVCYQNLNHLVQDGDSQLNLPLTRGIASLVLYTMAAGAAYVYLQWVGAASKASMEQWWPKRTSARYVCCVPST